MNDLNKVILIGRLGREPDIKTLQGGTVVCNLNIVTQSTWYKKDMEGEKQKQTKSEWHKIVTFDPNIINYCQEYIGIGDTLYIEGKINYRVIEAEDSTNGQKSKICEIHVGKYGGTISIFQKKRSENFDENGGNSHFDSEKKSSKKSNKNTDEIDDEEIPFDL